MENQFDTVIFDLDGTLVDTLSDLHEAINGALKRLALPPVSLAQAKKAVGPGKEEFLKTILQDDGSSKGTLFLETFREFYWDNCLNRSALFPGIARVLEGLSPRILAVATNKPNRFTEKILTGLHVRPFFSVVLGPDDVTYAKPHPEMIRKVLDLTSGDPARTIFIGDTKDDMQAARGAGVRFCSAFYGYGHFSPDDLLHADCGVQSPAELLSFFIN